MNDLDVIKNQIDIVDLISNTVLLKKAGKYYKSNCPFHQEKTPSFIVDEVRQTWRCYGACSMGGDIFSFVMKAENVEFVEALHILAETAGIELKSEGKVSNKGSLFDITMLAHKFFQDSIGIMEGRIAAGYLNERGLTEEVILKFGLGYSPKDGNSLKRHLDFHGVEMDKAVECGVLFRSNDGTLRDFFRGRLMFPIHNKQGRVVGFGARTLEETTPKYINTPTTPIFNKSMTLYGLHLAKESIRQMDETVIVEGYMDAIAAHERGFNNVVASMGTSLTSEQVRDLSKISNHHVLALDSDVAGQEATLRSLETSWRIFDGGESRKPERLFARKPMQLKIAILPYGKDPDDFIRSGGDWKDLILGAIPVVEYLISAVSDRFELNSPGSKNKVVETLAPVFRLLDPFEKDRYSHQLADKLSSSVATVRAALSMWESRSRSYRNRKVYRTYSDKVDSQEKGDTNERSEPGEFLEEYTLALILGNTEFKQGINNVNPECFHRTEDRELYSRWISTPSIERLKQNLEPFLKSRLLQILDRKSIVGTDVEEELDLDQCLKRLERKRLLESRNMLISSGQAEFMLSDDLQGEISRIDKLLMNTFNKTRLER